MTAAVPSRGDVWLVNLDPIRGHEQAGVRPAVILSVDPFNHSPAGLVVVVPMTRTDRALPLQVVVEPPEGAVRQRSVVMCENVRSVSTERLINRWGTLSPRTVAEIEDRVHVLLGH